jgi:O-antigen/teichoic acid export membrane protein
LIGKRKILLAGMWVTFIFGVSQIIRLGSNLVLTRLLEPEIFGVMAIVFVINFGVVMLTDLGLWSFIVRHKDPENKHVLNVVWTLQVIRSWVLFSLVAIVSAVLYFGNTLLPGLLPGVYANPLLPALIFVSGISTLIHGHNSMASAVMSRKMEVGKLELINLAGQLVSVTVMITWAWIYPTIWALVTASIVSNAVIVFLNYYLLPYKHKLALDKNITLEIFHYSKWIVLASTLTYIFSQGDRLFFGANITPTMLGVYSIAALIAGAIHTIIETLAGKIVFPALSSIVHNNKDALKDKYYKVRFHSDLIVFVLVGSLLATSQLIIDVLYDARYAEAGWMLQILLVAVIGSTLSVVSMECLSALSITKVRMWVMLVRSLGILIGLPIAFSAYGLAGALWAVSLNVFLPLPIVYWTLYKNDVFSFFNEIKTLPMLGVGYLLGVLTMQVYKMSI